MAKSTIDRFLATCDRPTTAAQYRRSLRQFAAFLVELGYVDIEISLGEKGVLSDLSLAAVTDKFLAAAIEDIDEALEAYSIELKRRSNLDDLDGEYLSQATINGRLIPIRRWLHYAAEKGLSLPASIFQYLKPKKPPLSTKMKGITAAEYQQILAQLGTSLDGDRRGGNTHDLVSRRDRAILRLLWDLGLRRCEITRLSIGDFDATKGILRVKGKGKGAKMDLHLAPSTVDAIAVYLDSRQERLDPQMAMFVPLDFHSRQRQGESRLTGQAIADILQKYANLAGIDRPLSPHRIRHSVITELIDTHGATLQDIKSFSRHESIDTLKHYFDRSQEKQLAATIIAASTIDPD